MWGARTVPRFLERPKSLLTEAQWREVLDTNLTSAFLVARAVAPRMIARGMGKVINICSVMSEVSRPTIGESCSLAISG